MEAILSSENLIATYDTIPVTTQQATVYSLTAVKANFIRRHNYVPYFLDSEKHYFHILKFLKSRCVLH
jgi:hypothetical protein